MVSQAAIPVPAAGDGDGTVVTSVTTVQPWQLGPPLKNIELRSKQAKASGLESKRGPRATLGADLIERRSPYRTGNEYVPVVEAVRLPLLKQFTGSSFCTQHSPCFGAYLHIQTRTQGREARCVYGGLRARQFGAENGQRLKRKLASPPAPAPPFEVRWEG
ncbi:hypothetical protein EVAR_78484_1 [Eumeta japonica]|uniref:Uncharacterized protein n=1 Tax=Eumeta variegata TaxID=151549 RepID=A0A4C1TY90_EUMVA|nr:hypothetical protein EVAR_78484_1 [Eumeta japonica]